jgi:hypothetical protein
MKQIANQQAKTTRGTSMTKDNAHDVVRVTTAANAVQAHVWQQALEDEGIPCKVVGDLLDAGIGDLPGISPEIWVHRDDLARAQEIIRAGEENADSSGGELEAES